MNYEWLVLFTDGEFYLCENATDKSSAEREALREFPDCEVQDVYVRVNY